MRSSGGHFNSPKPREPASSPPVNIALPLPSSPAFPYIPIMIRFQTSAHG